MSGKSRKRKQSNVTLRDEPISQPEYEPISHAHRITETENDPHGKNVPNQILDQGLTRKDSLGSKSKFRSRKEFGLHRMTNIDEQSHQQVVRTKTQVGSRVYSGHMDSSQTPNRAAHYGHNIGLTRKNPMVNQTNLRLREESEIHHNLSTHEIEHEQGIESDSEISETETHGPTCMKSIWGRPLHLSKIHVEYNDKVDPIDGECSTLSHFLGSIARNCQYCPISVKDWLNIENKDEILDIVKLRFHVPRIAEKKILSSVEKKWRSWKNRLKAKYWYEASVEVLVDQRDARVTAVEWMKICTYWNSEAAKGNMQEDTNKSQEDVDDPIDEDDDPIHQDDVFAQTIGQDQSTMQMTSKEISQSNTRETTQNTSKRLRIEEQGDAGQQSLHINVPQTKKQQFPLLR
ncbi:OLC1v1036298C1 [Oldenlandia corymbosa var. corymbosa]|uniref:OLC1v1036298C1 n=1 Tax=Oldenlandia corymbosa var. corymbosa TaxID=529605 RepID=A0AAV1CW80_OLDCO|nr:OLC1v1036298C1 [Oldenlandia corymbosa var. corymbosa]